MSLTRYVVRGVVVAGLFVLALSIIFFILGEPGFGGKAGAMLGIVLSITGWPATMLFSFLAADVIVNVPVSLILFSIPTLLNGGLLGAIFCFWLER